MARHSDTICPGCKTEMHYRNLYPCPICKRHLCPACRSGSRYASEKMCKWCESVSAEFKKKAVAAMANYRRVLRQWANAGYASATASTETESG